MPLSKQMAVKDVAMRAGAYGFDGVIVNGSDVLASYEAAKAAVEKARSGGGPTLVELKTYRFHPHTSDDDDRTYRSREEVEEAKRNDAILVFGAYLREVGILDDDKAESLRIELKAEVDKEVDDAWNAADPEPESAMDHLFASSSPAGSNGGASGEMPDAIESTGGEATPSEPPAGGGQR